MNNIQKKKKNNRDSHLFLARIQIQICTFFNAKRMNELNEYVKHLNICQSENRKSCIMIGRSSSLVTIQHWRKKTRMHFPIFFFIIQMNFDLKGNIKKKGQPEKNGRRKKNVSINFINIGDGGKNCKIGCEIQTITIRFFFFSFYLSFARCFQFFFHKSMLQSQFTAFYWSRIVKNILLSIFFDMCFFFARLYNKLFQCPGFECH